MFDYSFKNKIVDYTYNQASDLDCRVSGESFPAYQKKLIYALEFNLRLKLDLFDNIKILPSFMYNLCLDLEKKNEFDPTGTVSTISISESGLCITNLHKNAMYVRFGKMILKYNLSIK